MTAPRGTGFDREGCLGCRSKAEASPPRLQYGYLRADVEKIQISAHLWFGSSFAATLQAVDLALIFRRLDE